ncbi:carbohydrate-binding domain-containing protein [Candidatus Saccharibacteria bacterium]|nr:carbohydrate-binding domain-containing protein [Candidatus Saccharibacteria bacterium]
MNFNQKIALGLGTGVLVAGLGIGGFYLANHFTENETTTVVVSDAVSDTGSTELVEDKNKITSGGTYTFTGNIDGKISVDTSEKVTIVLNGVSIKSSDGAAIKCQEGSNVTIQLVGSSTITGAAESDGINSEGDLTIEGDGTLTIKADDDGIHADGKIEINGGTINITAAEGIEATYVVVNDGAINISASDDGINAANKSTDYSVAVEINGGDITIKMGQGDTDGIDSNGDLTITGGTVNITGQSAFDYDGTAKYTGGTLIVNGETVTKITNQFENDTQGGGGRPMMMR